MRLISSHNCQVTSKVLQHKMSSQRSQADGLEGLKLTDSISYRYQDRGLKLKGLKLKLEGEGSQENDRKLKLRFRRLNQQVSS